MSKEPPLTEAQKRDSLLYRMDHAVARAVHQLHMGAEVSVAEHVLDAEEAKEVLDTAFALELTWKRVRGVIDGHEAPR